MRQSHNTQNEDFWFESIAPGLPQPNWRPELIITILLQGTGMVRLEGYASAHTLKEGDLFVVNPYETHSILMDPGSLAISLFITQNFLTHACPELSGYQVKCCSSLYPEDKRQPFERLRHDYACLLRAVYKKESPFPLHVHSKLIAMLDDLYGMFLSSKNGTVGTGRERIWIATDYIHQHYRENVTLSDLSKKTFLSTSYLSRSFQKHLGTTFTEYLTNVRLTHAAYLLHGSETITEISYASGFPNTNALIEAFKQYHGLTPGQYRRNLEKIMPESGKASGDGETFSTAFASLMQFANQEVQTVTDKSIPVCDICCNPQISCQNLDHTWKRMINAGYAKDVLNGSVQNQLIQMQASIGFEYIRCKGILDDDMMLYTSPGFLSTSGESSPQSSSYGAGPVIQQSEKPVLNFTYLDELIDFILSIGAKPMLEFGFMPGVLAKHPVTALRRPSYICAPRSLSQWEALITSLMQHLMQRYGSKDMEEWLFSPWVGPELRVFGTFDQEEYRTTYLASYRAIKRSNPRFIVCGPGNSLMSPEENHAYFNMCHMNGCMPDILTFRSFHSIKPQDDDTSLVLAASREALHLVVSGDEEYLAHSLQDLKTQLKQQNLSHLPIMLDEWSNNIWQRDLCNDTCYKSAYLFKSILENYDDFYAFGYFNASDIMEEIAPNAHTFHGGFGLFTRNGIPKSAFRALELLNQMGGMLLARGAGFFITKGRPGKERAYGHHEEIQVFLYQYAHYDTLYRYRHVTNLTQTQRYKVFHEKPSQAFHIRIQGLPEGPHKIRRYSIGPNGGSTYDAWLSMGAPDPMTREEEHLLSSRTKPEYRAETVVSDGDLVLTACLQVHEVQLITISL